jgi:hypothetical protein
METILDHYHDKLAEQNMSEAEVIGERNTNLHLERSSYYYVCVLIMCPQTTIYVSSTKNVSSD